MKGQGQGPLRSVVRIGDRGKGQSPRFVILLECGHTVGRQLCRFGYNREANDRAHCIKCRSDFLAEERAAAAAASREPIGGGS